MDYFQFHVMAMNPGVSTQSIKITACIFSYLILIVSMELFSRKVL